MPHTFTSHVVTGRGLARLLGYPTINLALPAGFDLAPGVYACHADGLPGVLFFGTRTTFDDPEPTLEVHLIDDTPPADLTELTVEVRDFIRGVQKFENVDALKSAIAGDIATARRILVAR